MGNIVKELATESLEPAADHSEKRGYFVKLDNSTPKKATLCTAATDVPYGLIYDGDKPGGMDSVAINGGNAGIVRVKVGTNVGKGQRGKLTAASSAALDTGAGARVVVCKFVEDGVTDELVAAVLLEPIVFTA